MQCNAFIWIYMNRTNPVKAMFIRQYKQTKLPVPAVAVRKYRGLTPGLRPSRLNEGPGRNVRCFLPFDISLADNWRTSSGILSHWHSDRHRSISVSSREPDFLAVIFARFDPNTGSSRPRWCGFQTKEENYIRKHFQNVGCGWPIRLARFLHAQCCCCCCYY